MLVSARGGLILLCSAFLSSACWAAGDVAAPPTKANAPAGQSRPERYSAADRERRLAEANLKAGAPVMIRIFKQERELELWMQGEQVFQHFATYTICDRSGKLGPKLREGDRQAPEGFYRVDVSQLRLKGKNARSFYIDFPNAFDRALARTGSAIMVHGRCKSIGCYAMTDPAMEEIYSLVEQALYQGQPHIEVHAFPFRMTASNMSAHGKGEWQTYWLNLKEGYDLFEATRIPPIVSSCGGTYVFDPGHRQTAPPPDANAPNAKFCEFESPVEAQVAAGARPETAPEPVKPAVVAVKPPAPKAAGRNARKAYAAARRARMAAHARRARAGKGAM
jgi:murein L,D-transpeptidase YafK